MHIAIVTAGGAGMYCGSCMHDNTWARALKQGGTEVTLIPTYTPLRVDEEDQSSPDLFFGGINIYLEHRYPFWQKLPRGLTRWLDAPWAINLASRFAVGNSAAQLGPLTLAMLSGESGPQHREVGELVEFLTGQLKPDVICFSNILLAGAVRSLRKRFRGPILCVLQGDDVFLQDLPEPYQQQAIDVIQERSKDFDGFLVHSQYYREYMSSYLRLPVEKFEILPLGIDLAGHVGHPKFNETDAVTIGYFARICPEKGLHKLLEAFRIVHQSHPQTQLRAGGYLGTRDVDYYRRVESESRDLGAAFRYVGSPKTHAEKVEFLNSLDILSVPTVYREPKGIYVLEALANGVPVVQPRHGAFPELVETTGGGLLVDPDDSDDLAQALTQLVTQTDRRRELAEAGYNNVRKYYDATTLADQSRALFQSLIERTRVN
jgi:glycosyltransferase involved in cell wall biosynthesis